MLIIFFLPDQESVARPCCQPDVTAAPHHGRDPGEPDHDDGEPGVHTHINHTMTTLPPSTPAPSFLSGQSQSTTSITVTVEDYVLLIIIVTVALSVCSICLHGLCCAGIVSLRMNKTKLRRHHREAGIKLQNLENILNSNPPHIIPAPNNNDGGGGGGGVANQPNGNNNPPPIIIPGDNVLNNPP